jgi:putative ABC transport system ATP-binding protein
MLQETNDSVAVMQEPSGNGTVKAAEAAAVETIDLKRIYKVGSTEVQALRGINLRIPAGGFVALKGRSGSGKTTLLNCIGGLDRPSAGTVRVFGEEIVRLSDRQRTRWRSRHIGFIFQSFGLLPTLSAFENVELMLRIAGVGHRERRDRAIYCLNLVGLTKWVHHRPYELSGGQQQRVAIARALANKPRLMLADEPTGELDTTTAREVLGLFRQVIEHEQVTILMSSHDQLVDEYVDRVVSLRDGQVVNPENR